MSATTNKFADLIGEEKDVGGRPTKYLGRDTDDTAYRLALLGATDDEIAEFFGIARSTLYLWKQKTPSFSDALTRGKEIADADVAVSLLERAKGYDYETTHVSAFQGDVTLTPIKAHVPPDVGAIKMWLSNRRPKTWRDSTKIEHTGADGKDLIPETDSAEVARRLAFLLTTGVQEK